MPASNFLYLTVSSFSLSGTTLSIFFMKITSASISFRFSIRAPCPPGLKSNDPSSFLNAVLSGFAAIVSVLAFCSEKLISYLTLNIAAYLSAFSATFCLKSSI